MTVFVFYYRRFFKRLIDIDWIFCCHQRQQNIWNVWCCFEKCGRAGCASDIQWCKLSTWKYHRWVFTFTFYFPVVNHWIDVTDHERWVNTIFNACIVYFNFVWVHYQKYDLDLSEKKIWEKLRRTRPHWKVNKFEKFCKDSFIIMIYCVR